MQIWIDDRDLVFVTDQIPRISLLTLDGKLVGRCRGAINGAHGLCGDADGNLYLSELPPQEITKLERLD
jgi:peptidylglycine monooxygenase